MHELMQTATMSRNRKEPGQNLPKYQSSIRGPNRTQTAAAGARTKRTAKRRKARDTFKGWADDFRALAATPG